ncbi:hypothetical protein [Hymenobacter sp. GOD-10R]|uniref:hypothetical protein n=1 Tax=Hymenobacter sp. GOD-10R TaxID=3093922 RepID=UPI002D78089A|nr:hypothetical protein [Hymenobacter sp. GOD-10R]WRQ29370.1 hypothetical protein SD425_03715 [Hymenobacter sp. GOD-10R]
MATLPFPGFNSVPLGVSGSGDATVYGLGTAPLTILRQQDALRARQQQQEQQLQAKREAQQAQEFRDLLSASKLNVNGYLPFKTQIDQSVQAAREKLNALYQDPKIDIYQRRNAVQQLEDQHNSFVHGTEEVGKMLDQVRQTAKADPRYNDAAITTDLYNSLKDEQGNTVDLSKFSPTTLAATLTNAKNYDETQVVKAWLDSTFEADQSTLSSAARPGGYGQKAQASSNYFLLENGRLKLDPKTHQPIPRTELPEVQLAAEADPFLRGLLDLKQSQYNAQIKAVEQKMRSYEPLTEQERQFVWQEANTPKTRTEFLNELLLPHAYQRTSNTQTYSRPIAPKIPKATPKQSGTEVTVTPTTGYQASTYQPAPTGAMQRVKNAVGILPSAITNHYPTVGETFASARKSYAEVTVDNRGAEVVGQDGKTTALAEGNGKVPMQLVSRDYVLYVDGKRVGRKEPFASDADAYQYLHKTIDGLTTAQARKAELRVEYRGTLTDKARTGNDGAGGPPKPTTNIKAAKGQYAEPWAATSTTENRQSVIVPASQTVDAQLQRASGGKWNPKRLTPQQNQVVEALQRKGGRVVSPYTQTSQPATTSTISQGDKYYSHGGKNYKLIGKTDELGFGGGSSQPSTKAADTKPKRYNTGGAY